MSVAMGYQTVRARKEHQCDLCYWPISAGTIHSTWTWLQDDYFQRIRVHPLCEKQAQDFHDSWELEDGGDYARLLGALALLDDMLSELRGEVPDLPARLEWRGKDPRYPAATWWRYHVRASVWDGRVKIFSVYRGPQQVGHGNRTAWSAETALVGRLCSLVSGCEFFGMEVTT